MKEIEALMVNTADFIKAFYRLRGHEMLDEEYRQLLDEIIDDIAKYSRIKGEA